jgi:hypothetical protein
MGIILAVRLSARDAIIPPDKLRAYLLSVAHPDGRGKAEYLGRLGYFEATAGHSMRTFASRSCPLTPSRAAHRRMARSMRFWAR